MYRGEKHGPFLYMSKKVKGKTVQRYVGKATDKTMVKRVRAYMEYQNNLALVRKRNREIDGLLNTYREELIHE